MPVFMDEKLKKDSTIMNKSTLWAVSLFSILFVFSGCDKSRRVTENIPKGLVNLIIDLDLPSYMHLSNVGTHAYFDGGVRGILIIHDFDDQWYAFERTCAYQPGNQCSNIWVDSINIQLKCGNYKGTEFEPCCKSTYMYQGFPLSGPAAGRLAQYTISRNGNVVQVYN
jgi:Rieske Fe-S protein